MKSLMMVAMMIGTIFFIQIVDLEAALFSNQTEIMTSSVKHGPKFGDGWSEEQKEVWDKTQKWWQFRMASDWGKLKNLYHKDAILYHYFHKVPFEFAAYEELAKGMAFAMVTCTVHAIRIIEDVAIVMLYYEIYEPIPPKRMIFIWMKQGADWKLIADMNKEE
ncbi:MAG: nuclear transport factor 2 family protein [Desulfobacterales bacterium]